MDERAEHLPRRILDISHTRPDAASFPEQVLATVSRLTRRARESAELNDPQRYLQIFRFPLIPALFPHWGRPAGAHNAGVQTRRDARQ